jgi:glutathione S-transferase
MHLIGMLDSPYVRRCAISGTALGLTFQHSSISVFRHMDRFGAINPLYKAPSLIAADGTVLMDSALILRHFEDVAGRSLYPADPAARLKDLRLEGLGIVACDKAVGVEYERKRPEAQRHAPWMERIREQLATALRLFEAQADFAASRPTPGLIAGLMAWGFSQFVIPEYVKASSFPKLAEGAAHWEATPLFRQWPIDRE